MLTVPLDCGGLYRLAVTPEAAVLERDGEERLSRLGRALGRHLRIGTGPGAPLTLGAHGRVALPPGTPQITVHLGDGPPLAAVSLDPSPSLVGPRDVLSPFETRYLADNGHPHPASAHPFRAHTPRTDLHTHLAGAARAEDLVRLGIELDLAYPRALLDEAGVHLAAGRDHVPLASLGAEALGRLCRALRLPLDRQSTFLDMERVYLLRAPITKHERAFAPLLRQIALDLAAGGASYAELSVSEIVRADRLRAAVEALPAIEAETGVRLRFLVALSRHDDWEWDLDVLERIEDLAACRLLAGVDFMGHETNSTSAFARQLDHVASWAAAHRPGFVVRVHAGENPAHPENVRVAVERAARPGVVVRVGHGIHGVDDATLSLLRDRGVFVEVNPSSNLALNNIQSSGELPLLRCVRAGVDCVLGTDGHGIYQTSLPFEARAAWLSGATAGDLDRLLAAEARYLALREAADARLPERFAVPDDRPPRHYGPEVALRASAGHEARAAALAARLADLGIAHLPREGIDAWIAGRRCVSVAGAWARAWPAMPEEDRERVRATLDALIPALDPARVVLFTGGTRLGVEHEVQVRARAAGLPVLAVLVARSPLAEISGDVAAACVIGEALHDKAAGLYALMKEQDGLCLFFGGGNVVSDEIQTAKNLRLRYLLFAGAAGASADKARLHPRHAFHTAAEVLTRLDDQAFFRAAFEPFWHLGPNPTVDAAVFRRGASGPEVLLIRRDLDAPAEPGRWALMGGFVHTDAPRGEPWRPGAESLLHAVVREVREEAGLDLEALASSLVHVADVEGGWRDERDTPTAWSRTSVFAILLEGEPAARPVAGGDDACDARWWPLHAFPEPLAFDHAALLGRAREKLGLT
jgi:ADP-ribose pyrophosphatase YjhB (NUDIX family)/adenosine deaminase